MLTVIERRQALAVLEELRALEGPSREVDTSIAVMVGFQKYEADKVVWLHPDTRREAKVPRYTSSLSPAFDLAQALVPDHTGGCAWENGRGSAKIEPGPPVQAANPAIALCICAIFVHLATSREASV